MQIKFGRTFAAFAFLAVLSYGQQPFFNGFNGLEVSMQTIYNPEPGESDVLGSGTTVVSSSSSINDIKSDSTFQNIGVPPYAKGTPPPGIVLVNQNVNLSAFIITKTISATAQGTTFVTAPFAGQVITILTPGAPSITGVSIIYPDTFKDLEGSNTIFTTLTVDSKRFNVTGTNVTGFHASSDATHVYLNDSGVSVPPNTPGVIMLLVTFNAPCVVPSEEQSNVAGWGTAAAGERSVCLFKQQVFGEDDYSFAGRLIRETNAEQGVNKCNDVVINHPGVTGSYWSIASDNSWSAYDGVGFTELGLIGFEPIPFLGGTCINIVHQRMEMQCPDGSWQKYGDVVDHMSKATRFELTSERGVGNESSRRYSYSPITGRLTF